MVTALATLVFSIKIFSILKTLLFGNLKYSRNASYVQLHLPLPLLPIF